MATAQELNTFKASQNAIVSLAGKDLLTFWGTLDTTDALATSAALQVFMPELLNQYGNVSALVALNFFEQARQTAKVKKPYRGVLSELVPKEAVQANTRWALGPLFGASDPNQAIDNLSLVMDKTVKANGRNTIETNVQRDPVQARFARVPSGAKTCKFCLMLASRGAIYHSEKSAGDHYHGNCDCQPVPIWDENDLPEGYSPDDLYEEFKRREAEDRAKRND